MTVYLQRLAAGETPTADEWNEHVVAFHRAFGDENPASLFRTADGDTSYRVAARRVRELAPHARDVLDIGCGNGSLLAEIERAYDDGIRLHGIDLSGDEVARAHANLPRASILCADAASDFGKARFDVIVAHFSLLIMARVRKVLANAAAALRSGGAVAFITEDVSVEDSIFALAGSAFAALRHRLPAIGTPIPEREPVERDDALLSLLEDAGLRDARIERFVMRATLSREQLWEWVRHTYIVGLLDHTMQRELREALDVRADAAAGADGRMTIALPLRFVTARA
ncbi:MAG TPA: class I SAM-dependent methyltransferase [Candidatus Acidoferrales bacterium]|nr:class I SAM-dependent methyltransferase [Candidatus Acidoferrales bacterium]